jgi:hypothetical protein
MLPGQARLSPAQPGQKFLRNMYPQQIEISPCAAKHGEFNGLPQIK